jgi:GT2 family glycosyltransferase/glycosyltransferase involved in cell wall biosynthesis
MIWPRRGESGLSIYEIKEAAPPTSLDNKEIDYLWGLHSRVNSLPKVSFPQHGPKITILLRKYIQKQTLKYNKHFPYRSAKRNLAKNFVYSLPLFVRNSIISALAPVNSNFEVQVALSLDLGFGIRTSQTPKVSIIIPVYDGVWITSRCLRALQRNKDVVPFEIIVVDDASTDKTNELLQNLRGIRVIRNKSNLGYLKSTNLGASHARGQFIALLNNDTEPISGWLDELVDLMENDSSIAIAGSTLIFGNGKLQESGGQIFSNANAWNLGRGSDPGKAEFRFVREVDYCSAASVLIRSDFWGKMNGYDERYIPAYCEDSDIALSAWANGYRVVVCPTSWVIHHEGSSHGNSTGSGTKKYQLLNTRKLFAKWERNLLSHWEDEGIPRIEAIRNSKGIIVVCDRQAPSSLRDAGSVRTLQLLRHMKSLGFHVVFSATDFSTNEIELALLEKEGIEIHRSKESLINSLQNRVSRIRLYWLIRQEVFDFYNGDLSNLSQDIPVIADLIDLNYKRSNNVLEIDRNQIRVAQNSNLTLFCSSVESTILRSQEANLEVLDLWAEYEVAIARPIWSNTNGLLFVGGFRHQPNVDALMYFVEQILPKIKTQSPEMHIKVVGTGLDFALVNLLKSVGVDYLGRVEDLGEIYRQSRVVIAPLVSGGGKKGKIGEALSYGLPVVTTSIGAEGFDFENEKDAFVSDDPDVFVKYILDLESDEVLWDKSSLLAYNYAKSNLDRAAFKEKIQRIIEKVIGLQSE